MRKLPAVLAVIGIVSLAETTGESEREKDAREDACAPADEVCDEVDNDCDGYVDEHPVDAVYADDDRDGYGDPDESYHDCDMPGGFVDNGEDCDDDDPDINPDAEEAGGNEVDENCDGEVDPTCGHTPPEITGIDASFEPAYDFGGSEQPAAVMVTDVTDADGDLTEMAARVWVEIDGDGEVDTSSEDAASDLPTLSSDGEECSVGAIAIQYALSMKNYADDTDVVDIAVAVQDEGGNWSEAWVVTVEFE